MKTAPILDIWPIVEADSEIVRLQKQNAALLAVLEVVIRETERMMRMNGWTENDEFTCWAGPSIHSIQDSARAAIAAAKVAS